MNGEGRQETSKETTAMIWGYEIPTLGEKKKKITEKRGQIAEI